MGKIKHEYWHLSKTNKKEYNKMASRTYRAKTRKPEELTQHLLLERLDKLPDGVLPVPNWPSYYASADGKIYRDTTKIGKSGHCKIIQLKARWNPKVNYYQVQPYTPEGKRKLMYVHRMVLAAFTGEMRDDMYVNHKNLDRSDNNASNLEWVTFDENIQHFVNSGFVKKKHAMLGQGRNLSQSKHADIKPKIKNFLEMGMKPKDISKIMDIKVSIIYQFKQSRGYKFY